MKQFSLFVRNDTVPNILMPGLTRNIISVNGTVPGPAIIVDEGDWVEVNVTNVNIAFGTIIHWHGKEYVNISCVYVFM
jgi:FtsP/CotA-like multicopper oxidase with cupredoxin domain